MIDKNLWTFFKILILLNAHYIFLTYFHSNLIYIIYISAIDLCHTWYSFMYMI